MHSVSIDLAGGTLNGEYSPLLFVADGSLLELTTTPVRPGYGFAGYYYDSAFTSVFEGSTPVTSNLVLYTNWTQLDFVLTETMIGSEALVYKNVSSFSLSGELSSSDGTPVLSITRNGVPCSPVLGTGTWYINEAALPDGDYAYQIVASLAGIDQILYRNITLDTTNPDFVLTSSGPFTFTGEEHVFDGTANDPGSGIDRIEYSLDGGIWTLISTNAGAWTALFNDPVSGERSVEFRAVDLAQNIASIPVAYTNNFLVPYLLEANIGTESQVSLNASSVLFSGTFYANVLPTVEVFRDGVKIGNAEMISPNWSFTDTVPSDGVYQYSIISTVDGLPITINRRILIDRAPPYANIVSPVSPYTFLAGTVS
ncbi:MAG TPA: InlB B-repeat-containing protein, partial [Treponemataceae bacterium]|nr:InlB B-repeat-containing protein [Treponemataceae bacterium]